MEPGLPRLARCPGLFPAWPACSCAFWAAVMRGRLGLWAGAASPLTEDAPPWSCRRRDIGLRRDIGFRQCGL